MRNNTLIEKTVEITAAMLSSSNDSANQVTGDCVADFMQKIYNKLVEFNKNDD